jgi:hypothetical protein
MNLSPETLTILNTVLDVVLILAAIWMVITVRGLGGIIGKGLNLITVGAVVLGVAHLISTVLQTLFFNTPVTDSMGMPIPAMSMNTSMEGLIHRVFVLIGFMFLIIGFRQIGTIKQGPADD